MAVHHADLSSAAFSTTTHIGAPGRRLTRNEVFDHLYASCPPDDLVGIGSRRTSKSSPDQPHPHYEYPVPVASLSMVDDVLRAHPTREHYIQFNSFVREACPQPDLDLAAYVGRDVYFEAKNGRVSRTCALVMDLDVGRVENVGSPPAISADDALEEVRRLCADDVLPAPSMVAFSGRGLYIIYLLREALIPTEDLLRGRYRVITELLRRVRHLSPDVSASRALAHWFKAPDSMGGRVAYHAFKPDFEIHRWNGLEEIDAFLLNHPTPGDKAFRSETEREPLRSRTSSAASHRTWQQKARSSIVRKNELERLAHHRGMRDGQKRRWLLVFYGAAVRRAIHAEAGDLKFAQQQALEAVLDLNAAFVEPLPDNEARATVQSNGKIPHSNQTVAEYLHVTSTEVEALQLYSTRPDAAERKAETTHEAAIKRHGRAVVDTLIQNGMPRRCLIALTGKASSTISMRKKKLMMHGSWAVISTKERARIN